MFHVCFMYVSVFWGFGRIFADFFVSITEVAEDAEDAKKNCLNQDFQDFRISRIREEGIWWIVGLSESQKPQRTRRTLKEEVLAPEGRKVYSKR